MIATAATADDFVDATIANLKIVGMVPKGGKLCVRKGQLSVDPPRVQAVRRFLNGDSRDMTIAHIKTTIFNAIRIAQTLMGPDPPDTPGRAAHPPTVGSALAVGGSEWTLSRLLTEMQRCEVGLHNLKTTYCSDSLMLANLDVLIDRQNAHRERIEQHMLKNGQRCSREPDPDEGAKLKDGIKDGHGKEKTAQRG